jgi:hypothetical protein
MACDRLRATTCAMRGSRHASPNVQCMRDIGPNHVFREELKIVVFSRAPIGRFLSNAPRLLAKSAVARSNDREYGSYARRALSKAPGRPQSPPSPPPPPPMPLSRPGFCQTPWPCHHRWWSYQPMERVAIVARLRNCDILANRKGKRLPIFTSPIIIDLRSLMLSNCPNTCIHR